MLTRNFVKLFLINVTPLHELFDMQYASWDNLIQKGIEGRD